MLTADRSGDVAPSGDVRMSAQGENAKCLSRVDAFRFASEVGHCSAWSPLRICARSDIRPEPPLNIPGLCHKLFRTTAMTLVPHSDNPTYSIICSTSALCSG